VLFTWFNKLSNKVSDHATDGLDAELLSELLEDSSQPLTALSTKLNVSRQTIAARISRLEKSGVIRGYRAKVNYDKMGYNSFFVLFLKIGEFDESALSRALEEFRSSPHVIFDTSVTGEWDIMQILAFKDTQEYDRYLARIRTKYGRVFKDSKSHSILRFFKTPDEFVPRALRTRD
jgi:Lrp/AsnC family transcriptional regulator, leucine-responsive regulatory protein